MTGKLRLPPLNALRVFHAVARHRSFRQAADELLVTPQAVGQQIKLLEDTLQVSLFERKGRAIELTESAIVLSHFVKAGFDEFASCVEVDGVDWFAPDREQADLTGPLTLTALSVRPKVRIEFPAGFDRGLAGGVQQELSGLLKQTLPAGKRCV